MINSNEAGDGHISHGYEIGDQVLVALHFQLENGDPSAEWELCEPLSFTGTVVGKPAVAGSLLYSEQDVPAGSINVLPDSGAQQPAARPDNPYQSGHPRLVEPGEWYEKTDTMKILLRRSVTLIDPTQE